MAISSPARFALFACEQSFVNRVAGRPAVDATSPVQVLPTLLSQPAVTSPLVREATGLSRQATDNVITQLREAGIVTKAAGIQRYVNWVATDIAKALDDFAERARASSLICRSSMRL